MEYKRKQRALSDATKQKISDNKNAIAKELISGIIPDVTLLESVLLDTISLIISTAVAKVNLLFSP